MDSFDPNYLAWSTKRIEHHIRSIIKEVTMTGKNKISYIIYKSAWSISSFKIGTAPVDNILATLEFVNVSFTIRVVISMRINSEYVNPKCIDLHQHVGTELGCLVEHKSRCSFLCSFISLPHLFEIIKIGDNYKYILLKLSK